ncbi:hypothetical protein CDD83_3820 [Cordyceps sp. RAO-2017]|nr:hypothetical protein CDD83_3820 [Cordyceps sp. RAO-2017]
MGDRSSSPMRRRILSSINPDRPVGPDRGSGGERIAPKGERAVPARAFSPTKIKPESRDDDPLRPRISRLKLKRPHRRHRSLSRSRGRTREDDFYKPSSSAAPSRHRGRHHRRRHRSPGRSSPDAPGPPPLDAETAFRESLFDAMADDEAASYWEHVYGQPIHVYSNEKMGPQGELERMTDDEYAAYVRQKMFEKTHAGLLEEKARYEERKREKEREGRERRRQDRESARRDCKLREDVERSLRRGEARRQRKEWDELWAGYSSGWAAWDGDLATLPWPARGGGGGFGDMGEDDIRTFFVQGLNLDQIGERAFAAQLKEERVRWHPDKIQQRLGGKVASRVMSDVTVIFQTIDRLWGEMRDANTGGGKGGSA